MFYVLVAVTKCLTGSNQRETGFIWLTVQKDAAHHDGEDTVAEPGGIWSCCVYIKEGGGGQAICCWSY